MRDGAPLGFADPVTRARGIGPTTGERLAERGIETVGDLAWTLPIGADDLRLPLTVAEARARAGADGRTGRVAIAITVKSAHLVPIRGKRIVRVVGESGGATVEALWFFAAHGVLAMAKPGASLVLVGKLDVDAKKGPRMAHPDIVPDAIEHRGMLPRYDRTLARESILRNAIAYVLGAAAIEAWDPVPPEVAGALGFGDVRELLPAAHAGDAAAVKALHARLAWVEIFARVWGRIGAGDADGTVASSMPRDAAAEARFRATLGFSLTRSQERAVDEISGDLAGATPMRRLLQGDVGTGKTAVLLVAAAQALANGRQVAILAPTSVLLDQYAGSIAPLVETSGARAALLSAGVSGAKRARILEDLREGRVDLVVGTHALLSDDVTFSRLGLVVVDEQHRLGVGQRVGLVKKGVRPHLLTLSATPIPRTLALALRGELATSTLDERPRGRTVARTEVWSAAREGEAMALVKDSCDRGERVFVVVPRVGADDDDEADEPTAADRAAHLAASTGHDVALLHGRLSPVEKVLAMRRFRTGKARVLVSTTVIEVGVDVPEATLMIVLGAERFGLSQLHQLRGRVGRGDLPGRCVVVHGADIDDRARSRLEALARLERGEDVARHDLETRGMGDLSGTRQSGAEIGFAHLDPLAPPAWIDGVEPFARRLHREDPALEGHPVLAAFVLRIDRALVAREDAG